MVLTFETALFNDWFPHRAEDFRARSILRRKCLEWPLPATWPLSVVRVERPPGKKSASRRNTSSPDHVRDGFREGFAFRQGR